MDNITIAVTVNENYARHLGAMLVSLMEHTSEGVDVFVLYDHFSEDTRCKLERIASSFNRLSMEYVKVDDNRFSGLHLTKHLPSIAYYRFLLPLELHPCLERVIYLDPDLIVMDDIAELWRIALHGDLLAAIPFESPQCAALGIDSDEGYFNSGVMVINLTAWRDEDVTEQCFACARELGERVKHADQDVLNVVCRGLWKRLPLRWNMVENYFTKRKLGAWSQKERDAAKKQMGIIHFTGACKPWHFSSSHPMRKWYWKYLKMTPWADSGPDNVSFKALLIRLLPLVWKDRLVRLYAKRRGQERK